MKSAVMKMLVTPSSWRMADAMGSSVGWPATKVAGPPTGVPTVNLIALGLGVGSSLITGQFLSADRVPGELVQPRLHVRVTLPTGVCQVTIGIDVGGTFTDIARWDGTRLTTAKVPTTSNQSVGVAAGARLVASDAADPLLLHGTTVATNALLERRGARTVLVTDLGFEDLIEIGRQDRPSLYDPMDDRPQPLVDRAARYGWAPGTDLAGSIDTWPESIAVASSTRIGTMVRKRS